MKHTFVTHISRYQENVEQFIAGCPHHEQKPKKKLDEIPGELVQFRKHQLDNTTCLHSKSSCSANSSALRCGKDLQRLPVDHNYQIEQGEIQQRSNNTTYTVFIHIGNRDPTVSTHSRIQSSLAYRFFLLSFTVRT